MTLTAGTRLGSYEVLGVIGAGGMGEVYRARDTRLDRDVALKVLPELFAADADRLMRFEREAKTLAALNHPSIAQIFGTEESAGVRALVMELVDGEDLAQRIARGAIPIDEALPIAKQIAEALEAAHEAGVIHRDLKPANIKVRRDGTVKVLDFGLAKGVLPVGASMSPDHAVAATVTSPALTQMGVILGTAAYMAPEQAKGHPADARADIWAFGLVIYEMLTGSRPFKGDDPSELVAAVLRDEIDWSRLPAGTPAEIRRLLRRCLQRRPRERLQSIGDARIAIEEALASGGEQAVAVRSGGALRTVLAGAGLLVIGVALGFAGASWMRPGEPAPLSVRFDVHAPEGSAFIRGLAISPDGRHIAFSARRPDGRTSLWLRPIDSLRARELPDTMDARYPFWAPDGRRLGFFSRRQLLWVDIVAGGTPIEIAPTASVVDVRGAAWGADDVIVYGPTFTGPLLRVSTRGGASEAAVQLPASGEIGTARFPSFLPDGRRFLFYGAPGTGTEPAAIYLGRIGTLDFKRLGPAHSMAVFAEPGYLLYSRGEGLVAHAFDSEKEELVGEPTPLELEMGGSLGMSGLRSLALARTGTLVFRSDQRNLNQLVWVDRAGRDVAAITEPGAVWHYAPRLSPDRRLLVVSQYGLRGGLGELWVHDLARKRSNRVTFGETDDFGALWIGPHEFLFSSTRPDGVAVNRLDLERSEERRTWQEGKNQIVPSALTPDRRVITENHDASGRMSLWVRDLDGTKEPVRLSRTQSNEMAAVLSPNGRWIAYASDVSRSWEIYLRRLDGPGPEIRVSANGGIQPLWRPDGRELYYVDAAGRLVAVPIEWPRPDGEPVIDEQVPLFAARLEEANDRQYEVSADGQQFLLNRSPTFDKVPISVVLDWRTLLQGQKN